MDKRRKENINKKKDSTFRYLVAGYNTSLFRFLLVCWSCFVAAKTSFCEGVNSITSSSNTVALLLLLSLLLLLLLVFLFTLVS